MKAYFAAALVAGTLAPPRGAQGSELPRGTRPYASAAYDDALAMLNRLRSADHPAASSRTIDQHRAFCLLAPLRRRGTGDRSGGRRRAVVPAPGDASPRIRLAFTSVRRRMLPSIIQRYAAAKAAFDRKSPPPPPTASPRCCALRSRPDRGREAAAVRFADARRRFSGVAARRGAPPPLPAGGPSPRSAPPPPPAAPRTTPAVKRASLRSPSTRRCRPFWQVIIPRNGKLRS
jgi:hypothetical protein